MSPSLTILACSTCANSFREGGGHAAGMSIAFLLVVIVAVLGCVGFLMVRMVKRERLALDPQFQDDFGT
jgi:hypothetical protein